MLLLRTAIYPLYILIRAHHTHHPTPPFITQNLCLLLYIQMPSHNLPPPVHTNFSLQRLTYRGRSKSNKQTKATSWDKGLQTLQVGLWRAKNCKHKVSGQWDSTIKKRYIWAHSRASLTGRSSSRIMWICRLNLGKWETKSSLLHNIKYCKVESPRILIPCIQIQGREWPASAQDNWTCCHCIKIFTRKDKIHTSNGAWCMVLMSWMACSKRKLHMQSIGPPSHKVAESANKQIFLLHCTGSCSRKYPIRQ